MNLEPGPRPASKRCWSFDQYSSFDECDRTFAAHGIQADRDALTGGTHDGGYFAVRKGNIDEHALRFGDAVTHGKVGQQSIQPGGNRVERKISKATLRVIKSLTDQTESVIMKAVILSHPPFEVPDLDSQEP